MNPEVHNITWRALPAEFGNWNSVWKRFWRLSQAGVFEADVGSGRILIHQKICQTDLAAMADISREHVNRILNDWKRRQLVSQLEGYYCIENKAQPQKAAEL